MGPGAHPRRDPPEQGLHRDADRGDGARAIHPDHPLLRGGRPLPARRPGPGRHGLPRRRLDVGWLRSLEAGGLRVRDPPHPDRRAEAALQPPPAHARDRRGGPGEAPRGQGAADRHRRSGLTGRALPGRGGGRDPRAGRLRHRGRQQPPAPDPPHPGSDRHAQDPVREDRPQRAEPGRPGGRARRGPDQRERPPALPPVRRDRQRLRQLPDPLPGQRRRHLRAQAAGRRRHLPLRGPGVHDRPLPLALLPLPLPRAAAPRGGSLLRRGGGARGAARDRRRAPGHRGGQADPRRRASRSPAASSTSTPSTCASASSGCPRDPECPVCGENPTITEPIDYEGFCAVPLNRPAAAPPVLAAAG